MAWYKSGLKVPRQTIVRTKWSWCRIQVESGVECVIKSCTWNIDDRSLERIVKESAEKLYEDADFIFQQDLAPAQTARSANGWYLTMVSLVSAWFASKLVQPMEVWERDNRHVNELKASIETISEEPKANLPKCHTMFGQAVPKPIESM